jgi:glycosyltransferase involved in cell wall biosynthesis
MSRVHIASGDETQTAMPAPVPRSASVGMVLYGDVTYDSRVRREATTLARAGYEVRIFCLAGGASTSDLPEGVKIEVRPPPVSAIIPGSANPFLAEGRGRIGALRARGTWLVDYVRGLRAWGRMVVSAAGPIDVWHAHDLTGLAAIAPSLTRGTSVVYDSHELFLETGTALRLPAALRWGLGWYERRLVSQTTAVITVNEEVASILRTRTRTHRVLAVHNCPDRWIQPVERPTVLRAAADVPRGAPIILYHGALSANRGIEQLMLAILEPGLETAHLVLMGSGEMRDGLVRESAQARWQNRVHVLSPVLPADLLTWVASADVGAMPLQATTLNLRLSTPNKLFECLAAATPVIVSDFPGMRQIVIDNPSGPLGATCDPVHAQSIANAIRSILCLEPEALDAMRNRCRQAAAERWNWDKEGSKLLSLYSEITSTRR